MNKPDLKKFSKAPKIQWSDRFTVIYGNYAWLNDTPIHYCLATVSIHNLWDDIRLMGEISGVEKWGFEALFQRVVRNEWVKNIKSQYLESQDRFKFFPPVTIALLPCDSNRPSRDYSGASSFDLSHSDTDGAKATLNGLELEFPTADKPEFPGFGEPAFLRWDKARFMALAIDGQHRISALRRLIPRGDQNSHKKDVPATLLIFDPKLPKDRDLIQATREIFIDINKNAKTVDDSRLILLDDRNFYKGLTRKLILQAYPDGENPSAIDYQKIADEVDLEVPLGIPQELIDTAAGREAADVGKLKEWQYTSAFILNRSLRYFAFENRFDRFEELTATQDFAADSEDPMEADVALRREIYEDGPDDGEEVISDDEMLSFRPSITEQLVERVAGLHRGLWLGPMTAFAPYRKHIERFAAAVQSDDGDAIRALMLSEAAIPGKPRFETQTAIDLKADEVQFKRIKKALAKLSRPKGWEDNLVWYSVFQRGLLYQPLLLQKAMEAARGQGFSSRQEFAAAYVDSLNVLDADGWFDRSKKIKAKGIWNGIALKLGDSGDPALDGSDGAARRTGSMLRLMVCAVQSRQKGGYGHLKTSLNKHGISSAVSSVTTGMSRFLRAKDASNSQAKELSEYKTPVQKTIFQMLKEIGDAGMI